jgi:hypothetical protein
LCHYLTPHVGPAGVGRFRFWDFRTLCLRRPPCRKPTTRAGSRRPRRRWLKLSTKWARRSACCRDRYRSAPAASDPRSGLPAASYGGGHLSLVSEVFVVTT